MYFGVGEWQEQTVDRCLLHDIDWYIHSEVNLHMNGYLQEQFPHIDLRLAHCVLQKVYIFSIGLCVTLTVTEVRIPIAGNIFTA